MSPDQKLAIALLFIVAVLGAVFIFLRWVLSIGQQAENVDRDEDAQEAEDRVTSIKAALQEEAVAPNRHMSAKNYWSVP